MCSGRYSASVIFSVIVNMVWMLCADVFGGSSLRGVSSNDVGHVALFPEFSWDTVPLFAHLGRKEGFFTDREINYLARFPVVVIEKTHGMDVKPNNVEAHMIQEFKRIHVVNPACTLIAYMNGFINWPRSYSSNAEFLQHSEWALRDKNGDLVLKNHRYFQYDLSNPEVRDWWLDMVRVFANEPVVNGIFVDAIVQIERQPAKKINEWREAKYEGMLDGARDLLTRSLEILGPQRHLIFNGIFVNPGWWDHDGLAWNNYSTGMMCEFFAQADKETGSMDVRQLAREIEIIGELGRQWKIVLVKGWPSSELHFQNKNHRNLSDEVKREIMHDGVEFSLAAFLMGAEQGCYFGYSWGWLAEQGWFDWQSEFDKPLGPPKGLAVRAGNIWQREFEYASVWLDADKAEGRIEWHTPSE